MTTPEPLIALTEVGRTYRAGDVDVPALADIDLTIGTGEYLSIVGPSGSGKSTLLHVLGLLDRPTHGRYRFEGIDVGDLGEGERTALRGQRIGFVFQAFHLLSHRNVLENVALSALYGGSNRTQREERAHRALDRVGLSHRTDFRPSQLSGGERQRVAIARAIVSRPALLLCDEPTGNLDTTTSERILSLFDDLIADGLTLVVVTHDENVSRHARRTVRIIDGRLTEVGR